MKIKKYAIILFILSLVKLTIHLAGNLNYGFHRDELLHLAVSEHLDWGFMEFPPFIALVAKLAHFLFGYSLSGVRFFATLSGIAILIICGLTAKELGGKNKSVLVSGVAILSFLPFYRNHTLFQPVAFDQLFWTLGFFLIVKYINTKNTQKFLFYFAIAFAIGFLNKYTMVIWGAGIAAGFLFYEKAILYRTKWLYIATALALLIVLPNLIWQYVHHFPVLSHLEKLKESQLDEIGPYDFALTQLKFPFTLALSLVGLAACFFDAQLKKYKSIGIAVLVIFFAMWLLQSKDYYFFAAYPVLFAFGAVKSEQFFIRFPAMNYVVCVVMLAPIVYFIPKLTPLLPIESYVQYENLKPDKNGHYELTADYADMFGWEQQVRVVDSLYKSLPPNEREHCNILAGNYGEAGAIVVLGKPYGLPEPVCSSGTFWLWGPGKKAEVFISIGHERETVEYLFSDCKLVKTISHAFAAEEENGVPVYICRKPKVDAGALWPQLESHIFD